MNILTLIFSLLLILSYTFSLCWEKQSTSLRLKKTYVGHETANREILNQYESALYKDLKGMGKRVGGEAKEKKEEEAAERVKKVELNRECAQLNLWPLIQEGRDNHPLLFELTLKMIKTFYAPLIGREKRFEARFLTTLLKQAKWAVQELGDAFALEKIDLKDEELQRIYYKMLKGTKQWDLPNGVGYPSLLDYVKADPKPTKICIFHAHPDLITAVFGSDVATKLHAEIHKQGGPLLTTELIEHICFEMHQIAIDREVFELLELGKPDHQEERKTFIVRDKNTEVSLKRTFSLKTKESM